jgi:hypothetical protein
LLTLLPARTTSTHHVGSAAVTEALLDMSKPGGLLDAHDNLSNGPAATFGAERNPNNPDHPTHAAGLAFLAQFVEHDAALDLESIYGGGPRSSRQLYDPVDRGKFRVESGGVFEDVPRATDGSAVVADSRNDASIVLSGLHAAFLLAHNHALDIVRGRGVARHNEAFEAAQRLLRWHYQWLIIHELLPLLIGPTLVDQLLAGGRQNGVRHADAFDAPFRLGVLPAVTLTMFRPAYRLNLTGGEGRPIAGFVSDLGGGKRAPIRYVDWESFFDFGDTRLMRGKRLNAHLSSPLFKRSPRLIQEGLLRHVGRSLPSGQAMARSLRVPLLAAADLDELAGYGIGLERETPLFYYVLKEAELVEDGLRLGPLGGRIVGQAILGLLEQEPTAYLRARPNWRPEFPSRYGRADFRIADLLTFAGVDPATRRH